MRRTLLAVCVLLLAFTATASAATVYGVNTANQLIRFKTTAPGALELQVTITGLQAGEVILGIDVRPADGRLYALGSAGRLYTLNAATGAATLAAVLAADPSDASAPYAGLSGTDFGIDFDPVADRLRVVSDSDQNLRVNPDSGAVITDAALAYAPSDFNAGDNPAVTASAYSNNSPGATTTTLYGIDTFNDVLVIQNPQNDGTLAASGGLFLGDIQAVAGFDIPPGFNHGLLAYTNASNPSASRLASVSLGCCASPIGSPNIIGGGSRVRGITVVASSTFRLSAANYVVDEAAGSITIPVFRFGDVSTSASVTLITSDGTALAPFDYNQNDISVYFAPGDTVRLVTVSLVNNPVPEDDETFNVSLANPNSSEPITLGTPRTATVTITEGSPPSNTAPLPVTVFGVSMNNRLFSFRSTNPFSIDYAVRITGMQPGEVVLGIDVRPADGRLYALGSAGRLYTLNTVTGAATLAAPLSADPSDASAPFSGLSGAEFGIDFDPVADRLRVISDANQNLRVNPDTGAVTTDAPLAYASGDPNQGRDPGAMGAAYTNPDSDPATGTTLYDIDAAFDMLVIQNPPNNGTLNTVGPLNASFAEHVGFDIAPDNTAYASYTAAGTSNNFFRVSLRTGSVEFNFGNSINFPDVVRDIAVAPGNIGLFQLDANFYRVDEDAGAVMVMVNRTGGSAGSATVNFSTSPSFATAGKDYTTTSGTLTFGPGETSKSFTVPIIDDDLAESAENFNVILSSPAGGAALASPSSATVQIADDDTTPPASPTLSVADVTVPEGDTGALAVFTVTLSEARSVAVTAHYITSNGAASAGSDYEAVSGTLTFAAGQTSRTITVPVVGDDAPEPNETFFINLSNATNAAIADGQGQGTITDDDAPTAAFAFGAASFAHDESCEAALVTVVRTGDTSVPMSVDYATSNGTASDRSDYTYAAGTLEFAADETSKTIPILISEDSHVEGTETLTVTLSNPRGGSGLGSQASATVVIIDDASEPASNPIDDTATFVRQHYHDFLNRDADAAGEAFWTNNIESCGADAQCREFKRIDTSAAFFLSIEFQQTGFVVERAYQAAFNRRVHINEFLPDTQRLGRGVVVGQPGFEGVIEANKQAYFDAFVARPEFVTVYGALANEQFVDALNANTSGALSQSERDALVVGLNGGSITRAQALRSVLEDPTFIDSEFRRAFVLMQYFGYLRRDPDADGFNFWLTKLDAFGGDFRRAEMVKAFLSSEEYRKRFGQ